MWLIKRRHFSKHLLEAIDNLSFEIRALIARRRQEPISPDDIGVSYLQIGTGDSVIDGYINSDVIPGDRSMVALDARYPFPIADNSLRGIYAHHIVEHLDYEDVDHFFRECFRTLAPGGLLRIVVPDASIFIDHYTKPHGTAERLKIFRLYPDWNAEAKKCCTPLEMIDYVARDHHFNRHKSMWDWETAEVRLRRAGFTLVEQRTVNLSADPALAGHDKAHWAAFSLYVEARKCIE